MMRGLGVVDPSATAPNMPGAEAIATSPDKGGVPFASMLPGFIPAPKAFMTLGTSVLAGAVVGGLADDDWRGAFVGAGSMAALVSGYTLATAWTSTDQAAKIVLGTGGILSAAIAAGVYLRRRRTRR